MGVGTQNEFLTETIKFILNLEDTSEDMMAAGGETRHNMTDARLGPTTVQPVSPHLMTSEDQLSGGTSW